MLKVRRHEGRLAGILAVHSGIAHSGLVSHQNIRGLISSHQLLLQLFWLCMIPTLSLLRLKLLLLTHDQGITIPST